MEVFNAQKLKALDEEKAKDKKLQAESMMDASTLREMLAKTAVARFQEKCRGLGDDGEGV